MPSISIEEAIERYAARRANEKALGTIEEIANAAGITRQLLRYYYTQSLKKEKAASARTDGGNSPTARDGNGGRDSSQDTRTSKTA
jgi:hypothetical protein